MMFEDTINAERRQDSDISLIDVLNETEDSENTSKTFDVLESVLIDPTIKIEKPDSCLEIISKGNPSTIATLGNFSNLIGKAKSRKTFLVGITIASFITRSEIINKVKGKALPNKDEVILFDTEQGKYHLYRTVKRICNMANTANPSKFKAYGLRKFDYSERLELIRDKIYNSPNLGLVVIDGIRDLVTSINDEEQASRISGLLLKWTEELNIHIMVVLHQNKNDNNARGHLGAELVNKAETTLSVTKSPQNKDISIVEAEYCRDIEPEPFAFEINEEGLPVLAENWEARTSSKENGRDPLQIENFKKFQLLTSVFSKKETLTYKDLWVALQDEYQKQLSFKLPDAKAKTLVSQCKNEGWITQKGNRMPYKLGQYQEDGL